MLQALVMLAKISRLLMQGLRKTLTEEMVPDPLGRSLRAGAQGQLCKRTAAAWAQQLKKRSPSLVRMVSSLYMVDIVLGLLGSLGWSLCTCLIRPLTLKSLIDASEEGDNDKALQYAGVLAGVLFVEACLYYTMRHYLGVALPGGFLASAATLTQRKGLRLAPGVAGDVTERTTMNADIYAVIFTSSMHLHQLPAMFMCTAFGTASVLYAVGPYGMIGLSTMLFALFASIRLASLSKKYEQARVLANSKRLAITSRTLSSIKAVKFCAWEDRFLENIVAARREECNQLNRFRFLQGMNSSIGRVAPALCAATTYVAIAAAESALSAGDIFAVLSVFQALRMPLILIPLDLTYLAACQVAFGRITKFLLLPEGEQPSRPKDENLAVCMENVSLSWPRPAATVQKAVDIASTSFTLRATTLRIPWGSRCAVVGSVGAGKSSLLCSILGGLSRMPGADSGTWASELESVGFIPQRAFVISGTVLDNVVFGRHWDPKLFAAAVHAAVLDADLLLLPDGAETEIGEQGVTLSGGQKQRINIARAVYGCPKLLLLDDPLAAVDAKVAQMIFTRAILGKGTDVDGPDVAQLIPKARTAIMSLNQFSLLHKFDHVVLLESGSFLEQGAPKDLCESGGTFAKFVGADIGFLSSGEIESSVLEEPPTQKRSTMVLVQTEHRKIGLINTKVYLAFFLNMGKVRLAFALLLYTFSYFSMGFMDLWLSQWVDQYSVEDRDVDNLRYSLVYCFSTFAFLISNLAGATVLVRACVKSSKSIHDDCIKHLLHAPLSFFEETPSGRLLSRFGSDLTQIDTMLGQMVDAFVTFLFTLALLAGVICLLAPHMIAVMIVATVIFLVQAAAQTWTSREVKRMANNAMSPVLNTFGELDEENARLLVQAMRFEDRYISVMSEKINALSRFSYAVSSILAIGGFASYILALIISTTASWFLLKVMVLTPAEVALALTYSFLLPYFLQIFAQVLLLLNTHMTSVERMMETQSASVPQEPPWALVGDEALLQTSWGKVGKICFSDVDLIYREGLERALKSCTFEIPGGAKVGCVGRTGAGKSSVLVLLFRLVDAARGEIAVDGIRIEAVGLHTLRRKMAIIPQDPLLLEGSVRTNIDPFGQHSDERVANVLKRVGLADSEESNPHQLSFGERQLLQMARTLLRDVRIVVMDEPTSNIDPNTDEILQRVVREDFGACTVVTIAHRLETVIDNDRVLVLDAGRVVEYGAPKELLDRSDGFFAGIVGSQGEAKAAELRRRVGAGGSAGGRSDRPFVRGTVSL